jgi:hypothetical protein
MPRNSCSRRLRARIALNSALADRRRGSLSAWQAWLDGHLSLPEHWDPDGYRQGRAERGPTDAAAEAHVPRFVLAVEDDPRHPDPGDARSAATSIACLPELRMPRFAAGKTSGPPTRPASYCWCPSKTSSIRWRTQSPTLRRRAWSRRRNSGLVSSYAAPASSAWQCPTSPRHETTRGIGQPNGKRGQRRLPMEDEEPPARVCAQRR